MKITISSILLLLLLSLATYAQVPYSIKGAVVDTAEKIQLLDANIMVLNAKDSILAKYTRAAENGAFSITGLTKGKYILLIFYHGYADYSEGFTIDEKVQLSHDFGKLSLILKSRLLHDVIIKGEVTAIKIKGDTTEFNARAYVIQPNDRVEDLIKQFPGIEVDKDGKITAQGKTVEKVLVDGEEFFGDDPTLVTKNIRADMVDKVQLYDKKSDQATFTGIDDGIKTKTLNIKLKEDKKNGYFGKVDAGIGLDNYYQFQGMYNKFTSKQKFSAYSTDGNTGKTGLSWQEGSKYGDSSNVTVDDNGGISIFLSDGDSQLDSFNGRYDGHGIPEAKTGGVHYDAKLNNDKVTVNSNYKAGALDVNGSQNSLTQNNYTTGVITTNADQTFKNSIFREKLDFYYLVKLDTTSTLKIAADGTYKHSKTFTDYLTTSSRGPDTLVNRNSRTISNNGDGHQFNASLFYTKKLRKKGRTLSVLFNEAINNNASNGYLKSEADFYKPTGVLDSAVLIDQYKTNNTKNTVFGSNITYTEPLSKAVSLILNYGISVNNGTSDRRSYDQSAPGVYNVLNPSLSSDYKLDQLSNQGGIRINVKKGKGILNFGTSATNVAFKQIDEYTGNVYQRRFINWSPQANLQYRFTESQSLYMYYNGYTNQPSINQIQPLKVNTDPLNIFLGNPNLGPAFSNSLSLGFYSYKVLTGQSINFGGYAYYTSNQVVSRITTDPVTNISTIQYINLTDKKPYNYNFYGSITRKLKGPDLAVSLNLNLSDSKYYGYTNNVLTSSTTGTYSGSISVSKYVAKKDDFSINAGPNYNVSNSSLQGNTNNNGGGFSTRANVSIYLPAKFQLASDVNYTYTAKTATFDTDFKRTLLNASFSKSFFKENNLKFVVSGNDLLNQNVGFNRSANTNRVSQTSYTTIKRYFMLSVTWDFNKMGGEPAKK